MKGIILFVDDDPVRIKEHVTMLRDEDYRVIQVQTIKDAEKEYRKRSGNLNLIILDVMIPYEHYIGEQSIESRKGGIFFLKEVRTDKSKEQLPVVVFTVIKHDEIKNECFGIGCNDYLLKPCLPSLLLKTVQKYL